jgi:hypothetical protein
MALMAGRTRFGFNGMATAAWHRGSTSRDNWVPSYSGSAFQASLARWQERLQDVRLPSQDKVPLPNSRYDADRAVTQDLS